MRIHDDWSTAALDRIPVAADVGPFPRRGFLETWWTHRGSGELLFAETERMVLPLHVGPAGVEIVGEQDLTDYHSPLGGSVDDLPGFGEALAGEMASGTPFRLDSLPGEIAAPLADGLSAGGAATTSRQHEAAAVLSLPDEYEAHLGGLQSKDRHEIRRKSRRFSEMLGESHLVHGPVGFDSFVEMHRAAEGRKGEFLSDQMVHFFEALLGLDGAVLSLLVSDRGPVAAGFGFEDDDAYYLYHSAYAPGFAPASPGAVLTDRLIAAAIEGGKRRFDFLKGDESYKFKMGAVARPLFVLEGTA